MNYNPNQAIEKSKMVRNLRSGVRFIIKARRKYGQKFDYSNVDYEKGTKHVSIICPLHGEFLQSPAQHLRSVTGCQECGKDSNKIQKNNVVNGSKKCNSCNKWLSVDLFRKVKRRGGKYGLDSECIECSRDRGRERSKNVDKIARKNTYTKYNNKKRWEWIEETNPSSKIYLRQCNDCGKQEVLRRKPTGSGALYCKEHRSRYDMAGKTFVCAKKEVQCKKCGKHYIGKTNAAFCKECSNDSRKVSKKKNNRKRRALKRGASFGIPFKYVDIFKRDKFHCKNCGCKVQKKDIYADNAAEVDHIVPLSKGGPHIPSNVQTLCRLCNRNKSDKLIGQLSIFSVGALEAQGGTPRPSPMQLSTPITV